jgi:hypothetical protein
MIGILHGGRQRCEGGNRACERSVAADRRDDERMEDGDVAHHVSLHRG